MSRASADAVLTAALAALDAGGGELPATRELCRVAGVSNGSFFHAFGSRAGLEEALVDRLLADYRAALSATLADASDLEGQVAAVVAHHVAWCVAHPHRARFLIATRPRLDAQGDARTRRGTSAYLAGLRSVLAVERLAVPWVLVHPLVVGPADALCRAWLDGRLPPTEHPRDHVAALAEAAVRALVRPR